MGAIVFAGLGGAIVPITVLPGWARAVAPVTPTYWAMRGFRAVLLKHDTLSGVWLSVVVLLAFAVFFALVAATRFSFEETKTSWA
jgi:ABC-2 type transport system permease protein